MSTAGLIYLAICAGWLVYLVPTWLRRHDRAAHEAGAAASLPARPVLTRSGRDAGPGVQRRADRADGDGLSVAVDPAEAAAAVSKAPAVPVVAVADAKPTAAVRRARRVAAARRRRVLGFLILCVLTVNGLAAAHVLLWWSVAIPVAALVLFFVVARIQVRRQQAPRVPKATVETDSDDELTGEVTEVVRRVDLSGREAVSHTADTEDHEATIEVAHRPVLANAAPNTVPAAATEDAAVAPGLWDPVTVTLPTYVYKAKATPRTVRTVALDSQGVFSSASERSKDSKQLLDEQPAKPAAAAPADSEDTVEVHRRAVGD